MASIIIHLLSYKFKHINQNSIKRITLQSDYHYTDFIDTFINISNNYFSANNIEEVDLEYSELPCYPAILIEFRGFRKYYRITDIPTISHMQSLLEFYLNINLNHTYTLDDVKNYSFIADFIILTSPNNYSEYRQLALDAKYKEKSIRIIVLRLKTKKQNKVIVFETYTGKYWKHKNETKDLSTSKIKKLNFWEILTQTSKTVFFIGGSTVLNKTSTSNFDISQTNPKINEFSNFGVRNTLNSLADAILECKFVEIDEATSKDLEHTLNIPANKNEQYSKLVAFNPETGNYITLDTFPEFSSELLTKVKRILHYLDDSTVSEYISHSPPEYISKKLQNNCIKPLNAEQFYSFITDNSSKKVVFFTDKRWSYLDYFTRISSRFCYAANSFQIKKNFEFGAIDIESNYIGNYGKKEYEKYLGKLLFSNFWVPRVSVFDNHTAMVLTEINSKNLTSNLSDSLGL